MAEKPARDASAADDAAPLALIGIGKRYGALRAVDGASLRLARGRVHAIIGENGAGKSTLLKIAAGVVRPDEGQVLIDGAPLRPHSAREAGRRGVGMVHQHFMLVPTLTGRENLALGVEPSRFGLLDLDAGSARAEAIARELALPLRLDVPVEQLGIGERQRLEIVRVLARAGLRGVLILDEPTALLGPADARALLALVRRLAADGAAVALVTHHLDEVVAVADEVTVMRRGRVIAAHRAAPDQGLALPDAATLAREALGEIETKTARAAPPAEAGVALALEGVRARAPDGGALEDVTLRVSAGEIVGVAGVEGNGQRELELTIAGLLRASSGRLSLAGIDVSAADVAERRRRGLAWIPGDRHEHAVAGALPVTDALRLGALDEVRRGPWVDEAALGAAFREAVVRFELRPDDPAALVEELSGGNQQKLVVARELRTRAGEGQAGAPKLLLAVHPTRGVDARAAARIHASLVEASADGAGVLLLSSDLDELRALAHRIVVLRRGRLVAELPPDADVDAIGAAMLGGGADAAHAGGDA
jgi:simple sugar transport system ATP-binding protein